MKLRCLFPKWESAVGKPLRVSLSAEPATIGEHIRKRRAVLRLTQSAVAELLAVSEDCVTNWENERSKPQVRFLPSIFRFLGYIPHEPIGEGLASRIGCYRIRHGLSLESLARAIGVDPTTLGSWEKGRTSPKKHNLALIIRVIDRPIS